MLYRLAYFSHARLSDSDTNPQDQLRQILLTARRNNAERHITGALLSTDRYFAQVLEGEEDRVKALYQQICRDPRHERLTILSAGEIAERQFGRWSMRHLTGDASARDAISQLAMHLPQTSDGQAARSLLATMADMVTSPPLSETHV
ncbi:BLUF domain-containing protein [Methyloligella solikamskensis]|uniref:BLUF domain-containing protein n=1 Tax=Methyloligella solikamskensis TaxID=1177756 RepID=A0ABW3JBR9_9HYPH